MLFILARVVAYIINCASPCVCLLMRVPYQHVPILIVILLVKQEFLSIGKTSWRIEYIFKYFPVVLF